MTTSRRRRPLRVALGYLGLAVIVVVFLVPIVWFLALAIRPPSTDFAIPPVLAFKPNLSSLHYTFVMPAVSRTALIASIVEAGVATLIALPLSVLASYGLARYRFRGREAVNLWYLGFLLVPPIVFVIPVYVMMAQLHLVGTYWSIIIAFQSFSIPLGVMLLRSFIEDIPFALEESAMIDGANRLTALLRVTLPVAAPGVVVAGIFIFVFCWNNLLFPVALASGSSVPLSLQSMSFFATTGISWNYIAATASVTMLVPMVLFLAFRGFIVQGLSFGAIKG